MAKTKWDIPKFKELCKSAGITYPRIYTKSVLRKKMFIDYHAELATQVWKDFFKKHKTISFNSPEWLDAEKISEANSTAMVQNLHSMADITAQIVYRIILNRGIKEDKISFYNVKNKIKKLRSKDKSLRKVYETMKNLSNNDKFQYIAALVNTIKHRSVIDTTYTFELKQGIYKKGMRFKGFKYNSKGYPEVWTDELSTTYKEEVLELIIKIGCAINDYLEERIKMMQ